MRLKLRSPDANYIHFFPPVCITEEGKHEHEMKKISKDFKINILYPSYQFLWNFLL